MWHQRLDRQNTAISRVSGRATQMETIKSSRSGTLASICFTINDIRYPAIKPGSNLSLAEETPTINA